MPPSPLFPPQGSEKERHYSTYIIGTQDDDASAIVRVRHWELLGGGTGGGTRGGAQLGGGTE